MPRQLYFDVGAFDPRYEMGYYEDTDLAMAVRKAGLFVLYQPGAVVYHQVCVRGGACTIRWEGGGEYHLVGGGK